MAPDRGDASVSHGTVHSESSAELWGLSAEAANSDLQHILCRSLRFWTLALAYSVICHAVLLAAEASSAKPIRWTSLWEEGAHDPRSSFFYCWSLWSALISGILVSGFLWLERLQRSVAAPRCFLLLELGNLVVALLTAVLGALASWTHWPLLFGWTVEEAWAERYNPEDQSLVLSSAALSYFCMFAPIRPAFLWPVPIVFCCLLVSTKCIYGESIGYSLKATIFLVLACLVQIAALRQQPIMWESQGKPRKVAPDGFPGECRQSRMIRDPHGVVPRVADNGRSPVVCGRVRVAPPEPLGEEYDYDADASAGDWSPGPLGWPSGQFAGRHPAENVSDLDCSGDEVELGRETPRRAAEQTAEALQGRMNLRLPSSHSKSSGISYNRYHARDRSESDAAALQNRCHESGQGDPSFSSSQPPERHLQQPAESRAILPWAKRIAVQPTPPGDAQEEFKLRMLGTVCRDEFALVEAMTINGDIIHRVTDLEMQAFALRRVWMPGRLQRKDLARNLRSVDREVRLLRSLSWASAVVAKVNHIWLQESLESASVVMEWLPRTLADVLGECMDQRDDLCLADITRWMTCMATGLTAIHSQNIMHHDVKAQNVMLCEDLKICKIVDFGLGRIVSHSRASFDEDKHDEVGTAATRDSGDSGSMSTETGGQKHSPSADVFSLGRVFLELMAVGWHFDFAGNVRATRRPCVLGRYAHQLSLSVSGCPAKEALARICAETVEAEAESRPSALEVARNEAFAADLQGLAATDPHLRDILNREGTVDFSNETTGTNYSSRSKRRSESGSSLPQLEACCSASVATTPDAPEPPPKAKAMAPQAEVRLEPPPPAYEPQLL